MPERVRSSSKEVLRDKVALDFVGAHVDLERFGVAHVFLYRVFLDIAIASEDLYSIRRDLHSDIGRAALGNGCVVSVA